MSSSKSKAKKHSNKKEHQHDIPPVQTAKGRRPHTEEVAEPYQPSLLNETDLQPQPTAQTANEAQGAAEAPAHETILEGQPAPKPKRSKLDVKEQIETVKGVVQLGTALVKSSFPKPFEMAEKVVEEWKQDGDFSELPISQPLVQFYVGLGLRKAKQTEKDLEQKLETAGVLPVVRQQWQRAQKLFK